MTTPNTEDLDLQALEAEARQQLERNRLLIESQASSGTPPNRKHGRTSFPLDSEEEPDDRGPWDEDWPTKRPRIPASLPYGFGYGDRNSGFVALDEYGSFDPGIPGTSLNPHDPVQRSSFLERGWKEAGWTPRHLARTDRAVPFTTEEREERLDAFELKLEMRRAVDRLEPLTLDTLRAIPPADLGALAGWIVTAGDVRTKLKTHTAEVFAFRECQAPDCHNVLWVFNAPQTKHCRDPECLRRRARGRAQESRKHKSPGNAHVTSSPSAAPLVGARNAPERMFMSTTVTAPRLTTEQRARLERLENDFRDNLDRIIPAVEKAAEKIDVDKLSDVSKEKLVDALATFVEIRERMAAR